MENLTDDMDKLYPFAFFLTSIHFFLQNNYEQKKTIIFAVKWQQSALPLIQHE